MRGLFAALLNEGTRINLSSSEQTRRDTAMKTIHTVRLLPVLLLLPVWVGCDSATGVTTRVTTERPEVRAGTFKIESQQYQVNSTTMEGTFEATGSIGDQGSMREAVDLSIPLHRRGSIHGMKTLTGKNGTMTIRYYVSLSRTEGSKLRAHGGFRILSGTGAYEELSGQGQINTEIDNDASLADVTRVLEGVVE